VRDAAAARRQLLLRGGCPDAQRRAHPLHTRTWHAPLQLGLLLIQAWARALALARAQDAHHTDVHEYILNTTATDFWAAERICNARGGHLVAYDELEEQVAVEQVGARREHLDRRRPCRVAPGTACSWGAAEVGALPPALLQCFIQQGFLLPKFHQFYWMGLASGVNGAAWPNFTWIDHVKSIYM
jgi:hypothetical protein